MTVRHRVSIADQVDTAARYLSVWTAWVAALWPEAFAPPKQANTSAEITAFFQEG